MNSLLATPAREAIQLETSNTILDGDLTVPAGARGLVVFAHGTGSGRHSTRNRAVAEVLHMARLGTLMLDLLTEREERADTMTGSFRFNVPLLAQRVVAAVDWAVTSAPSLGIGLFGASTGAAAALIAAAIRPESVRAVVSRGGRPDLAEDSLDLVSAPTLLIVGALDPGIVELNQDAFERLHGRKELQVVPDATHLFEEPAALDHVARLAREWFVRHV
ncbi:MAG TPA: dienelactone hydrolase family protein [Vicinamibacterales bacterium]|nr:dienelactone hydrolase family protein [Vicinamibacterales bacterium]